MNADLFRLFLAVMLFGAFSMFANLKMQDPKWKLVTFAFFLLSLAYSFGLLVYSIAKVSLGL